MNMDPTPFQIATKLAASRSPGATKFARQLESEPRIVELLWHLEWCRRQPGGVVAFFRDAIAHFGEEILPDGFLTVPCDRNDRFSFDQLARIWKQMPTWSRPWFVEDPERICAWIDEEATAPDKVRAIAGGFSASAIQTFLDGAKRGDFVARAMAALPGRIASSLAAFLQDPPKVFPTDADEHSRWGSCSHKPWLLFEDLPARLIEFIDLRAQLVCRDIAPTQVTRMVFEALDYAWEAGALVPLLGSSRFGKSASAHTQFQATPGRFRVVQTPSSGGETDLLFAVARALGIDEHGNTSRAKIKRDVQFVLEHCGKLGLIFDEGHWLLPPVHSRTTNPLRLNWVRSEIVDRGLPCLLISTPQSYEKPIDQFTKTQKTGGGTESSGYKIEQWIGRETITYRIPDELNDEDVVAVAKVRFQSLPEKQLKQLVSRAMQTGQPLPAIDAIAKRAIFLAKKSGHGVPSIEDINLAADQVVHGVTAPLDVIRNEREDEAPASGSRARGVSPATVPPLPRRESISTFSSPGKNTSRQGVAVPELS